MFADTRLSRTLSAALFTSLFLLIGWRQINPYAFSDLETYRVGFESQWTVFQTLNASPVEFLLREGVWARLFDALYTQVGDMDVAFTIVSISAIFLMSMYVVRQTRSVWYLLFFFNPTFIDLTMSQIRSGLAAGLFWFALSTNNRFLRWGLLLLSPTIHTAFFLFVGFYLAFVLIRRFEIGIRMFQRPAAIVLVLISLGFLLTFFREVLLASVGDERAFQYLEYTSGILLAAAWASFLVTYLAFRIKEELPFDAAFFALNAAMSFFSALFAVYGSRFAAIIIPAIAVMAFRTDPRYRFLFVLQYAAFSAVYFVFWFRFT